MAKKGPKWGEHCKNQSQEAEKRLEKGPTRPQVGSKAAPRGPKAAREPIFGKKRMFFKVFLALEIPRCGPVGAGMGPTAGAGGPPRTPA